MPMPMFALRYDVPHLLVDQLLGDRLLPVGLELGEQTSVPGHIAQVGCGSVGLILSCGHRRRGKTCGRGESSRKCFMGSPGNRDRRR